jgi:hypothetical protein
MMTTQIRINLSYRGIGGMQQASDQAERVFVAIVWRKILAISPEVERFATWTLTGVGAATALIVSNLDGLAKVVNVVGIQWTLVLLAVSILAGTATKQLGAVIALGLTNLTDAEQMYASPQMKALMDQMTVTPNELREQMVEPFFWPLSASFRKSFDAGAQNPNAGIRRFVGLFNVLLYCFWAHAVLAILSLLVLAFSMR